MPITSHKDLTKQLTTFVGTGEVSFNDIVETLKPYFEGRVTKNILWDFREAQTHVNEPIAQVEKIVKFSDKERELRSDGKTALVGSNDLIFGLLRMYETFAEIHGLAHAVKVFRGLEEAQKWLNEG